MKHIFYTQRILSLKSSHETSTDPGLSRPTIIDEPDNYRPSLNAPGFYNNILICFNYIKLKALLIALLFVSITSFGQITYFGSASNPADNGALNATSVAVTPPGSMAAGDLVVMISHSYITGNTQTINATGGQTWTSEATLSTTNSTGRIFWCRFNGTWSTNPSVSFSTATATSVIMHVFSPTVGTNLWAVDVAQQTATYAAATNVTITGQTSANSSTVTLASWFSVDNNTWGSLTGAGWAVTGNAQYRINSGSDNSSSYAHFIGTTPGATGNVRKTQSGSDAGQTSIITFYEYASGPPPNDLCSGAILLTSGVTCTNTAGTLILATATAGLPACGNASSPDVWYKFVAQSKYPVITLSSVGANLNTAGPRIQLFSGTCGSLTQLTGACVASPLNTNVNPGGVGLTIGATYYVRITTTGLSAPVGSGSYNFNICITDPDMSASARVDLGKTYVNITDGTVGGSIDPGDVLEIRATLVVQKNLAGVHKGIDSIAYYDTLMAGKGFAYVPGSLSLRTNEGKLVTSYTDSNADLDPGWYSTGGVGTDTTIQMNMGVGAIKTRGGSLLSSSRPSFYGGTCIIMATFRVTVNAGYDTKINFGGGAFRYRDIQTGIMFKTAFSRDSLMAYQSPGACPDAVSPLNLIGDEYNGTFGAPPTGGSAAGTQNRAASPNTTYIDTTFGANAPQDYYYGVANNTSATNAIVQTVPKGHASRVFTLWDITGDHTGAVNTGNTSKGNKPCDPTKIVSPTNPCGYLLAINSAYKTDVAFEYNATGACSETYYEISAWFKNLCYKCGCDSTGAGASSAGYIPTAAGDSSGVSPNIAMEIDGIDYFTTGNLTYQGLGGTQTGSDTLNNWVKRSFVFKTLPTQNSFKITFRNNAPGGGGNDWAVDDISIRTCYPNMIYSPSASPTVCAGRTLTIADTVRSYYNVYIYYKWQRSTDGGVTWADIAGTSGVASTVWNGGTYEYTNSYTLPPSATNPANNGDQYRMVVATNAINLAGTSCNYSDVTPVTLTVNNCIDIDDDNDGIPDYVEFNNPVALQDANSNGIPNWNDPAYPLYVDNNFDGVNDNFDWGADSDNDGIPNYMDINFLPFIDANSDGINDLSDKDLDGIPNQYDLDSDNDGIPDVVESYGVDTNGDGIIDNYTDTDGDGFSQNVDANNTGVNISGNGLGAPDFDGDGIPNYLDTDSDNDGIPDVVEAGGTDINNNGLIDGFTDANADGLSDNNFAATALLKTGADISPVDGRADDYPNKNMDRDFRPNAYDLDSDGDGIADVIEAGLPDANLNGLADGVTGTNGWSTTVSGYASLNLRSSDSDSKPDYLDIDSDDDGIPDNIEGQSTAGYLLPGITDTDGDGIVDTYDNLPATFSGSGIYVYDHDADGTPDYRDTDTDNDGLTDIVEGNDFNLNGMADDLVTLTGLDTDGDGLDNRFDSLNSVTNLKGTSYRMGNGGSFTGDATPGSRTTVQKTLISQTDRDWRYVGYVLPVQFLNFTGTQNSNNVLLSWTIIADKEVDRFEIERSIDNANFSNVGIVTDPVKLNEEQSFSFADNIAGISNDIIYYRLKVIGKAGQIKYSNVFIVRKMQSKIPVTIMPNPANNYVNVNLYVDKNIPVSLVIIDKIGRKVLSQNVNLTKGFNNLNINLDKISEGVYALIIETDSEKIVKQLIVIR